MFYAAAKSRDIGAMEPLFGLAHQIDRVDEAGRVHADRVDAELDEESRDLPIGRRRLAADADMPVIALRPGHRKPQHFQHSGIALVEEGHDLGNPVYPECELCQIIGSDRKTIEFNSTSVDLDNVVGDLANHVDFKAIPPELQPMFGHDFDNLPRLLHAAAERDHYANNAAVRPLPQTPAKGQRPGEHGLPDASERSRTMALKDILAPPLVTGSRVADPTGRMVGVGSSPCQAAGQFYAGGNRPSRASMTRASPRS